MGRACPQDAHIGVCGSPRGERCIKQTWDPGVGVGLHVSLALRFAVKMYQIGNIYGITAIVSTLLQVQFEICADSYRLSSAVDYLASTSRR